MSYSVGGYPPPLPPPPPIPEIERSARPSIPAVGNGLQVTAIVTGIFGVIFGLVPLTFILAWAFGLTALVVGLMAYRRAKPAGIHQGRAGVAMGIVALVLGGVGVAIVDDAFDDLGGSDEATITDRSAEPSTTEPQQADRPTTTAAPTTTVLEEPPTLAMGETLSFTVTDTLTDEQTDVDVVVSNPASFTEEPVDYGMTPTNGLYLVLDVSVVVAPGSAGTYSVDAYNFKFVAADGSVAETTYASFEPALDYVDLSAGQRVAGKIVFDINPAQMPGGHVQLDDTGENYNEPFAYWAV